jgi:hypothetical protein
MNNAVLLVVVLQLGLVTVGNALRCYECNGRDRGYCFSPINTTAVPVIDCKHGSLVPDHHHTGAYKCVAYLEHRIDINVTFSARHCVKTDGDYCESYKRHREQDGVVVDKCTACSDDLCNSGEKITGSFVFLTFVLLIWNFRFFHTF